MAKKGFSTTRSSRRGIQKWFSRSIASTLFLSALAGLFLSPSFARASDESIPTLRDATSVRAAGMAGATRGFAVDTDAILVNPAAISALPHLNISGSAMFVPAHKYSLYSIGAVDSKINSEDSLALSGGISYNFYKSGAGDESRSGSLLGIALSLPLAANSFSVGLTGKYFKLSGAVSATKITLDAAAMVKVSPLVGISAIGYNLIETNIPEAKRSWALGIAVGKDTLHADFDIKLETGIDGKRVTSFGGGAEVLLADFIMPRAGYFEDKLRGAHMLTGGLSIILSGFSIDAAYTHAINGKERGFGIALRIIDWPAF